MYALNDSECSNGKFKNIPGFLFELIAHFATTELLPGGTLFKPHSDRKAVYIQLLVRYDFDIDSAPFYLSVIVYRRLKKKPCLSFV